MRPYFPISAIFSLILSICNSLLCYSQRLVGEPPHAYVIPHHHFQSAINNSYYQSQYYINLLQTGEKVENSLLFTVTIPSLWVKREVFLYIEALDKPTHLTLNGHRYMLDSLYDFENEWRVTSLLKKDSLNTIGLLFSKPPDTVFQCFLYSTPKLQFRDFIVQSDYSPASSTGTLVLQGEVRNLDKRDYYKYKVQFALYDAQKKLVFSEKSPLFSFAKTKTKVKGINYTRSIPNIKKWSTLSPYLYTLVITMWDGDDNSEIEIISAPVAFRKIDLGYKSIFLNENSLPAVGVALSNHVFKSLSTPDSLFKALKRKHIHMFSYAHYLPKKYYYESLQHGMLHWPMAQSAHTDKFIQLNGVDNFLLNHSKTKPFTANWADTSNLSFIITRLINYSPAEWKINFKCTFQHQGKVIKKVSFMPKSDSLGNLCWKIPYLKMAYDSLTIQAIIHSKVNWINKNAVWHSETLIK